MGAAASVLPREKQEEALQLVRNVQNNINRNDALEKLWKLADQDKYKIPLCDPQLHLLETIKSLLETVTNDPITLKNATGIIWYLSREGGAKVLLCSEELKLVPVLLTVAKQSRDKTIQEQILKGLSNCSLIPETHAVLLTPEYGFLSFLKELMISSPEYAMTWQVFHCLASCMIEENVIHLINHAIPELMMSKLVSYGTNVELWPNRWQGPPYWCLNFAVCLSSLPSGRKALSSLHNEAFLMELVKCPYMESVKAAVVIANLLGKEEGNNLTQCLLVSYPAILPILLKLYSVTLNCDNSRPEVQQLRNIGFAYGIIKLNEITCALKNLSISDKNKAIMTKNQDLLILLLRTIQLFIEDAPECSSQETYTKEFAGGGGKDYTTIENCLELLLQLSFSFDDDEILQKQWKMIDSYSVVTMLQQILNLPASRNVPFEARNFASTLLNRFQPKIIVNTAPIKGPPTEESSATYSTPQHVMLSYAWAAHKSHVISLGKKLREMGYDVWRDEDGSSLVSAMSGDIVETMAEAIQRSHTVVICVSPEYKESANCRAEAKYASARQSSNGLKLVYVMMDQNYHTKSTPKSVDGWLGFMVGTELWYPLWEEKHISSTATAIAGLIGNNAKRDENASISKTLANMSGKAAPVHGDALSAPAPKNNEPPDYVTGWGCLEGKKSHCPKTLHCYLEEAGLFSAEDLENVDQENLELLSLMLKKAPMKAFRKAMRI